jgi:hypothetical protein
MEVSLVFMEDMLEDWPDLLADWDVGTEGFNPCPSEIDLMLLNTALEINRFDQFCSLLQVHSLCFFDKRIIGVAMGLRIESMASGQSGQIGLIIKSIISGYLLERLYYLSDAKLL